MNKDREGKHCMGGRGAHIYDAFLIDGFFKAIYFQGGARFFEVYEFSLESIRMEWISFECDN